MDLFPPLLFCVAALVYLELVVDTRAGQANYAAEPVAGGPRVDKRNANATCESGNAKYRLMCQDDYVTAVKEE